MESPTTERAAEMWSQLGNADMSGQKPRRTQSTAEHSGELKQRECKCSKWNLTRINPLILLKILHDLPQAQGFKA